MRNIYSRYFFDLSKLAWGALVFADLLRRDFRPTKLTVIGAGVATICLIIGTILYKGEKHDKGDNNDKH